MSAPRLALRASALRPGVFAALEQRLARAAREGQALAPFHIGDTYVAPPRAASAALAELDPAVHRYGPTAGLAPLREGLAAYVAERRGLEGVSPREVLVGAGGTHALHCVASVLLDPGDEVLLLAPYWPLAPGIFEAQGAACVEVPVDLYAEPTLSLRPRLEAARTSRTRAVYFVSPNNPDGKVLGAAHLEELLAFAEDHDLWLFADEVYADVTYGVPHTSLGALPRARARAVLLYSFSKSFALAGQRVGFAVAPEPVVAAALRAGMHTVFNVPLSSQRAALAALAAPDEFLEPTRAAYRATRDAAAEALAREGVECTLPDGGVYFFLELGGVLGGRALSELLLHGVDHGVLLAPGEAFGRAFGTRARLCFTSAPHDATLAGIAALGRALRSF